MCKVARPTPAELIEYYDEDMAVALIERLPDLDDGTAGHVLKQVFIKPRQ